MVLQPAGEGSPSTLPATRPTGDPATRPGDEAEPARPVAYMIIENGQGELEPVEFPPAKLFLKRAADGRVRAHLYSDDPPEAMKPGWRGDSFYFEMELEIPADSRRPIGAGKGSVVAADELAAAEWLFRSETSERSDAPSGIFLGGDKQLQPIDVAVAFQPLDDELVMVTLVGTFAEFNRNAPRDKMPVRKAQVQAVIEAAAIRP